MTPDSPKLSEADAAVLDRAVAEFREGVAKDLQKVSGSSERLKVLSKLSEDLGAVRNRLSGALRVKLGRFAFVMGLLVVGGVLGAGGTLALRDRDAGQNPGTSRQVPEERKQSAGEAAIEKANAEQAARAAAETDALTRQIMEALATKKAEEERKAREPKPKEEDEAPKNQAQSSGTEPEPEGPSEHDLLTQ